VIRLYAIWEAEVGGSWSEANPGQKCEIWKRTKAKRAWGVVQVVESKWKALSSNSSTLFPQQKKSDKRNSWNELALNSLHVPQIHLSACPMCCFTWGIIYNLYLILSVSSPFHRSRNVEIKIWYSQGNIISYEEKERKKLSYPLGSYNC
jgi:hypothetical protein